MTACLYCKDPNCDIPFHGKAAGFVYPGARGPLVDSLNDKINYLQHDLSQADIDVETALNIVSKQDTELQKLRNNIEQLESINTEWQERFTDALDDQLGLREEIEQLKKVIHKHYPTIAGHVLRLQEAHEDRAANEWLTMAQDFAAVLK